MELKMKRPELEDRELLERYLAHADTRSCEMTFGNIYLWSRFYNTGFAIVEDNLIFGEVDGVFCMDDATLNDLMQTICAYADEVEIPVFGVQKEQVESGCLAAYDGTLYWNATEAGKLGKSADALSGNVVTVD